MTFVHSPNNSKFGEHVDHIYLIEFGINDITDTAKSASYFNLHLEIDSERRLVVPLRVAAKRDSQRLSWNYYFDSFIIAIMTWLWYIFVINDPYVRFVVVTISSFPPCLPIFDKTNTTRASNGTGELLLFRSPPPVLVGSVLFNLRRTRSSFIHKDTLSDVRVPVLYTRTPCQTYAFQSYTQGHPVKRTRFSLIHKDTLSDARVPVLCTRTPCQTYALNDYRYTIYNIIRL